MVCLLAAPWVQLSVSAGNGWPHNALRHHWLTPISCHFRDCKALLVTSLAHVSGTIASVQTFTFYLYIKLVLQWGFAMVLHSTVWQSSLLLTIAIWKWQKKICPTHSRIGNWCHNVMHTVSWELNLTKWKARRPRKNWIGTEWNWHDLGRSAMVSNSFIQLIQFNVQKVLAIHSWSFAYAWQFSSRDSFIFLCTACPYSLLTMPS